MEELLLIVTVASAYFIAAVSPGPNFVVVVKNAMTSSRGSGLWTAFGVSLGTIVHTIASILGLSVIISKSVLLFNILKFVGGAYLIYMAYKTIRQKESKPHMNPYPSSTIRIPTLQAIRVGFLTNLLNPKTTLFFLSLFTVIASPTSSLWVQACIVAIIHFIAVCWYSSVALFFSQVKIQEAYARVSKWVNRAVGMLLFGLGVKLLVSEPPSVSDAKY